MQTKREMSSIVEKIPLDCVRRCHLWEIQWAEAPKGRERAGCRTLDDEGTVDCAVLNHNPSPAAYGPWTTTEHLLCRRLCAADQGPACDLFLAGDLEAGKENKFS